MPVVACGDPAARHKVASKVEGKTGVEAGLFAYSDFPDVTSSFWRGVQDRPGSVLCRTPGAVAGG